MAPTPPILALLVGINEYHPDSGVTPLRGCVNDVRALAHTLAERYAVPQAHIVTLVNEAATRTAIEQAFRDHLIAYARAWAQVRTPAAGEPPAFLFYFSGHGSQARDLSLQEPDGMDETIVPYDGRTPGVFDIRDWELGRWLAELNVAGDNVTVILDCCNSGSGTRDAEERNDAEAHPDDAPRVRSCPPDLRRPPTVRPVAAAGFGRGTAASRSVAGPSAPRHVLLAACRDREIARELAVPDAGGELWRGSLSYFLQQALYERRAQPLTYAELHERLRLRIQAIYPQQTPQCEGTASRLFLGRETVEREPFFTVVAADEGDGMLWIDAGILHGVTQGSLLRAYAPETRTRAEAGEPLATLEVVRAGVDRSGCRPVGEGRSVPLLARVAVGRLGAGAERLRVRLHEDALEGPIAAALEAHEEAAAWVQATETGAQLEVLQEDEGLVVYGEDGAAVAGPYNHDRLDQLALDLAHIARFRTIEALHSDGGDAALAGAVEFAIKRLEFDAAGKPFAAPIPPVGGEPVVEAGQLLVYEINNRSPRPLYAALYVLTEQYQVQLLWPTDGAHTALGPGKRIALGQVASEGQFQAELGPGQIEARDRYKLLISPGDFNSGLLVQDALGRPYSAPRGSFSGLDRLLQAVMAGERGVTTSAAWTTVEAELRIVAAADADVAVKASSSPETGASALPLRFEPPDGFDGTLRPLPATALLDAPPLPPGLIPWSANVRPLSLSGAAALSVDCSEAARRTVTPQTPLRLRSDTPFPNPVTAVAWDGQNFLPVGRAAANEHALVVDWLPAPSEGAVLGVGRTVRLYLLEWVALPARTLGLFAARFVPDAWVGASSPASFTRRVPGGQLRYTPAGRLRPGEQAALVIHGFADDSAQEAHWLIEDMAEHGLRYDRVITFEYESLRTSVAANAERLRDALAALGLGEAQGATLDIYAHSMGALVARAWMELLGGAAHVRATVLTAPPNAGTPLSSAALLAPWLVTLALNIPQPTLPGVLAAWAAGSLTLDAWGPADMRPGAPILQELAGAQARTRYHVITGETALGGSWAQRGEQLLRALARGLNAAAQWFFDGPNDLVVGVRSALALRAGSAAGSLLLTRVVAAAHTGYFESDAVAQQVARWLLSAEASEPAAPEPLPPPAEAEPDGLPEANAQARPVIRFRKASKRRR